MIFYLFIGCTCFELSRSVSALVHGIFGYSIVFLVFVSRVYLISQQFAIDYSLFYNMYCYTTDPSRGKPENLLCLSCHICFSPIVLALNRSFCLLVLLTVCHIKDFYIIHVYIVICKCCLILCKNKQKWRWFTIVYCITLTLLLSNIL